MAGYLFVCVFIPCSPATSVLLLQDSDSAQASVIGIRFLWCVAGDSDYLEKNNTGSSLMISL
jgi:hypothetical protein